MKKLVLLLAILGLINCTADAGIISTFFGNNSAYHNGYYNRPMYYNPPVYYNNYYPSSNYYNSRRYYNPQRRYYNYQRPIIYKQGIKRSLNDFIKPVSNSISGIEKLEKQLFQQTFEYDRPEARVERLEQKLFGAYQKGGLDERVELIKNASKNYKAFTPESDFDYAQPQRSVYDQYRPPMFTGTMGSNWRNTLWGNFKNQFAGVPTGFTPAMDPAYMDYFEADRALNGYGHSTDIRTNRGYHRSNVNRGTGMGVTILD